MPKVLKMKDYSDSFTIKEKALSHSEIYCCENSFIVMILLPKIFIFLADPSKVI